MLALAPSGLRLRALRAAAAQQHHHHHHQCAALTLAARRSFSSSSARQVTDNPIPANDPQGAARKPVPTVSATNEQFPISSEGSFDATLHETVAKGEALRVAQAPNRVDVWSRSQAPRRDAMVGPRFEQTIMEDQPRPYAAIELIHKQPVRWIKEKMASCDGGGGPLGHPRIFINVDKPQICGCTYCGVPYAKESNRKYIEALPHNSYPLDPTGDEAEVPLNQSNTGRPLEQR